MLETVARLLHDLAVRRRTQIVRTLTAAVETARPTGIHPALTSWFEDLVDAMRSRWDEARREPREFRAFALH